MGGGLGGNAAYDAALERRQALMGASGARALVKNFKVARIAAFACIGGVLYGYNQGMFSGILAMPSFGKHMDGYIDNPTLKGWLTAILELGAWVGTLLSGFIAEVCSRKYGVLIATGVFMLGVIVQITSITGGHESILAGRFITGCNYIGGTEVETQSDAAWLVPICLQLGPAIVLFVGMIWMPFSPRWLIHHGREEEALTVLSNLRDLPPDHELIELEYLEIKAQSLFEKRSIAERFPHLQQQTAWNVFKLQFVAIQSLFKSRAMIKRVIVATVTMFHQQWSGINAVLYYAPQIFAQLGLSQNTTSLLATGVVGVAMFLATIPAVLWIDRVGRKPILIVTPDMLVGITYGTYILFGLLTYIGAAFVWFVVPETKRLSLEEMDLVFGSEGTAQADFERMEEINREIGLSALLNQDHGATTAGDEGLEKPKVEATSEEHA
ncbi:hypothetical protein ACHAQA_005209 [Verticillium albo-atrum]